MQHPEEQTTILKEGGRGIKMAGKGPSHPSVMYGLPLYPSEHLQR
uniref:Uncharacterized protein n=1 Tax=Oryza nivara TaxID=4536 RepID=A0A0E0IL35_ORYNI